MNGSNARWAQQGALHLLVAFVGALALVVAGNAGAQESNAAAAPEARTALVIGNSEYKTSPLRNPGNDAEDIARTLSGLGFRVQLLRDATQSDMKQAIRRFGADLKAGGIGFFYFAGHGVQLNGRNYLVPVSAEIESEADLEDQSVDAALVLSHMANASNRVNLVVLDACRNNPFARSFRAVSSGLAQMDASRGTLVAFATAPGEVARDGDGRNGVYTKHLLQNIVTPGVPVEIMFKRVRDGVARETNNKQIPWESTSLQGADFFFVGAGAAPLANTAQPAEAGREELMYWDSVKASQDPGELRSYMDRYPNGSFVGLASSRLKSLLDVAKIAAGTIQTASAIASKVTPDGAPSDADPSTRATTNKQPGSAADSKGSAAEAAPGAAAASSNELMFWDSVKASPNADELRAYLDQYPKGIFAPLAKAKISTIERTQKEAAFWDSVKSSQNVAEFKAYLEAYPQGHFSEIANAKIRAIESQPPPAQLALAQPSAVPDSVKVVQPREVEVFGDCADCPQMVIVQPGSFRMGSAAGEKGREADEGPQRDVRFNKRFAIARTEVTFAQWQACNKDGVCLQNPSDEGWGRGDRPVINVSYQDVQQYLAWLRKKTGRDYRLPTEAEWEFAARAGSSAARYWGDEVTDACRFANVYDRTGKAHTDFQREVHNCFDGFPQTSPVGKFKANEYGLFDMLGNVWEWVEDCWHDNYQGSPEDGSSAWVAKGDCGKRVVRGGAWISDPRQVRAAERNGSPVTTRNRYLGFRVARSMN
jgi:formylglycine-generating enzyme required for sulfatase activity